MEQGTREVPGKGVAQDRANSWAREIRDYLLGRPSRKARSEVLQPPLSADVTRPPICHWWIFEGKRYAALDASLGENLVRVIQQAKRLVRTFNPRLRLSDRPDREVDWGQTLARGLWQVNREYVVRSSGVGLDENERMALFGWIGWIKEQWDEYAKYLGKESHNEWPHFDVSMKSCPSTEQLRRWAHVTKRSRWPLLHGIVAESIRPFLEPDDLDRIPLPSDEAKLFELLCLVRIANCLAPGPRELRWLTSETNNKIRINTVWAYYQQSLKRGSSRDVW